MLNYGEDIIKNFFNADRTRTLVALVFDLKEVGADQMVKEVIVNKIQELKAKNEWDFEVENVVINQYLELAERQKKIDALSDVDRQIYQKKFREKCESYSFSL